MSRYIITGSSDGLGKKLSELLLADGHEVIGISKSSSEVCTDDVICDFTDIQQVEKTIQNFKEKYPSFTAIVHCVGKMYFDEKDQISAEKMSEAMHANVIGITALTSGLMGHIVEHQSDIVFVSSTVGFKAYEHQGVYTATKRAERGIAKYFQEELAATGSRVVSFCPGGMQTRFHEKCTGSTIDQSTYMPVEGVATCLRDILYLPKYMEVSEIVINRKVANIK